MLSIETNLRERSICAARLRMMQVAARVVRSAVMLFASRRLLSDTLYILQGACQLGSFGKFFWFVNDYGGLWAVLPSASSLSAPKSCNFCVIVATSCVALRTAFSL